MGWVGVGVVGGVLVKGGWCWDSGVMGWVGRWWLGLWWWH